MSYLALARKWRPRTFSQLVGQEHINKALINALNHQRLHHAYLFTGTRGVGKTSVARILAKSLNCEQGIRSEPCLQCDACNAIEQGRFIDLIEIDGASKTRVEDTRDLLDNVQYAPASGRFKIYLIDEVHMLSQHSFNALLKTLEEPPEHVKFILATTDPQKLPVTVLSRCLQFNLKHLPADLISQHLQLILKDEKLDFEIEALTLLAKAARGSMRDALSLLDQAITSCDTQLQARDVKMILGYTQHDYAIQLLQALAQQNAPMLLSINQQISAEGEHFQYVLDELLHYLHQMTVYQSIGDNNPLISPTAEVKMLAQMFSAEDIQLFYQIGLKSREEIQLAPTLAVGFSMAMLRMLTFRPAAKVAVPPLAMPGISVMTRSVDGLRDVAIAPPQPERDHQNQQEQQEHLLQQDQSHPQHVTRSEQLHETICTKLDLPVKLDNNEAMSEIKDWASIVPLLKLTGLALNALNNAEFITKEGREILLRVAKGHQSLFTPVIVTRIEAALSDFYQSPVKIILNSDELVQASPAQQKERETQQKQQKAETALQNDPVFQQLQHEFSAELVKNSIVPLNQEKAQKT